MSIDIKIVFPQRLKDARIQAGLTQSQVAVAIGVSESAYGYYEQGRNYPTLDSLNDLAEVLEISVDYLLGRTSEAPTGSPTPDPLLPQLLAHLTRIEQSMAEIRDDIRELKEIAQCGTKITERVDAHELDIKLIKKAITKE